MHYEEQTFLETFTDDDLRYTVRVSGILHEQQRIQKNLAGALEGDAVLLKIRPGFLWIPCEQQPAKCVPNVHF